ncbi:MAG: transporter [Solirubrobacterales bacterium]|nr:transporter [Solirubrobacterales bacterium]
MPATTMTTPNRWRWLAFAAVLAAAVMDLLDSTIAQVAAPSIRRDLGGSFADLEWISAAYTLAMAVTLLTGGRLGDLFGRRRMLMVGIAGFLLASIACAAAATPGELIAARAAQGALSALMLPQVMGLMRDLFRPEEMGKAFGVYGPVMGLSAMLGPILAGALIGADFLGSSWRMIFLVNVPVGVFALVTAARLLPTATATAARGARLDLTGAALAGVGMCLLVLPLVQGHQLGWPGWLDAMLGASVAVLGLFALHQVRRKRAGATPLVEPGIFTHRGYASGIAFSLVFIASLGGIVLIFNLFLQAGLGFSAWHAAIGTAPWAAGAFVGSAIGGITMHKLGRRVLHAGLVVESLGLLGIYVVFESAGTGVGSLDLLAPMIVGGIGMGMVFVPLFDIAIADVEPSEIGSASAVLQSVNGLSMSLGVAGLGAIFFGLVKPQLGPAQGFLGAAEWTTLITVALLALAFAIAYWLPRHARPVAATAPALDAAPAPA